MGRNLTEVIMKVIIACIALASATSRSVFSGRRKDSRGRKLMKVSEAENGDAGDGNLGNYVSKFLNNEGYSSGPNCHDSGREAREDEAMKVLKHGSTYGRRGKRLLNDNDPS